MTARPQDPLRLLIVCTANQCRSPMAAVLAEEEFRRRGIDAVVVSEGMMKGGMPASAGAAKAVAKRGLDLSQHVSQQLDPDTIAAAGLIITMEQRHIRAVAEHSLDAVGRSFTLRELVDLAPAVGPRGESESVSAWIRQADAMRIPGTVIAISGGSDIADPMGGSLRGYRRSADEIDGLIREVIEYLYPADT